MRIQLLTTNYPLGEGLPSALITRGRRRVANSLWPAALKWALSILIPGFCRTTPAFAGIMVIPRDLSFVSTVFIPASALVGTTDYWRIGPPFAKITILVPDGTAESSRCNSPHGVSPGLPAFLTCTL